MAALLAVGIVNAQTIKKIPAKPTTAVDGKTLYHDYCAVCHGVDGKGAGPAAAALKPTPTDLTQVARRNNGRFDDERMVRILSGQETITAHGNEDMPWGTIFHNMNSNPGMAQTRIHALVQYLDGMQAK